MTNNIEIFKSEEFGEIRTIVINGEPWFVGKDVAIALGYAKPQNAIAKHIDEDDSLKWGIIDSMGRNQDTTVINESGLYSLIFGSKLESATRFKRWVTSEVLPTIRKTGGYVNNEDAFINTYLPFADDQTRLLFRTTLQTVNAQNKLIKEQQETITKQKNELDYKEDVIIGLVDEIDIADKRQILNRVVKHNHANYKERWGLLYREFDNKYHIDTRRRMENYNANKDNKPKMKTRIEYIDKVMNKIPELYEIATKLFESDINELIEQMYGTRN